MTKSMNKKFLSNIIYKKYILAILIFGVISCSSSKNDKEICAVPNPRSCDSFITEKITREGNNLPGDGLIYLEDRTYFITYFDYNVNKIIEKYLKIDCNCEIIYFDETNPIIKNSIN